MVTATNLRKMFDKGAIPLVKVSAPKARFLDGDFGRAVNDAVQAKYGKFGAISKIRYADGVVKGSNPFYVTAVNEVISPEGLWTATPADLERAIDAGVELEGTYEDSALVLRDEEEPNKYLARTLAEQIKPKKFPAMVLLKDLRLKEDKESQYGLSFKLKDGAEVIHAPQLSGENHGKRFSKTDENGLLIFCENGKRTLYTINSGLSGLCLCGFSGLDSVVEGLDSSSGIGRVVVVSSQSDAKN